MRVKQLDTNVLTPIRSKYTADRHLVTKADKHINTSQGINIVANPLYKDAADVKINNSSCLTLTQRKYSKQTMFIEFENVDNIYPYTFVSYMIFNKDINAYYRLSNSRGRTSYPGDDRAACFLQIKEEANDQQLTRAYTISSTDAYSPIVDRGQEPVLPASTKLFKFELLNETECRIIHDDGYVKTCLTYSDMNSETAPCTFEKELELPDNGSLSSSSQIFNYSIHVSRGYFALAKTITNGTRVIIEHIADPTSGRLDGDGGLLAGTGVPAVDQEAWPLKSIMKIRSDSIVDAATYLQQLDTVFVKYETDITTQNSMQVDQTRKKIYGDDHTPELKSRTYFINSMPWQSNNFLLNTQYHSITGDTMSVNYTVLKNQLTPEGLQSDNSPMTLAGSVDFCLNFTARENANFRDYHKIHSGTNQIKGDNELNLSYTSYSELLNLRGDHLTYFHMPESMNPYYWMNINYRRVPSYKSDFTSKHQALPVAVQSTVNFNYEDFVGLCRAGAIPGNDPLTSDKIFKKRADYRYFSNWGDSGRSGNKGTDLEGFNTGDNFNGTYLCSWLQAPADDAEEYQYGPVWMDRYYDDSQFSDVTDVIKQPPNCVLDYIKLHDKFGKKGYFDTPSELTLDRGVLYAYHHIGQKDNQRIVNSFKKYLVQDGLSNFTQVVSGTKSPAQLAVQDGYDVYNIDGTTYGSSKTPEPPYGDFRLSFWVYSDDWSKPMGHQLLGNYVNDGFAVVCDDVITPICIFQHDDRITFRNTDGKVLTTIHSSQYTDSVATVEDSNIFINRTSPLGYVTIFACTQGYALVTTVNYNGAIVDTLVVDDPNFTSLNKKISKVVTYKPRADSDEWDRKQALGFPAPEELAYVMYEDDTETIGQINLVTGEYRNPGGDNYFFSATVSGVQVFNSEGKSLYDGNYIQTFDNDGYLVEENGRPIYQLLSFDETIPSKTMFWEGTRYVITGNTSSPYTIDNNSVATQGDVPESGGWYFNWNNVDTNLAPVTIEYDETLQRPIYVNSTLYNESGDLVDKDGNPQSPEYRDMYITDDGYVYIVDGTMICTSNQSGPANTYKDQGGTNRLFWVHDDDVYMYSLREYSYFTVDGARVIKGNTTIRNMKVDEQENIWLWMGGYTVAMYDKNFNFVFSTSLTGHVDGVGIYNVSGGNNTQPVFDLIKEYRENGEAYTAAQVWFLQAVKTGSQEVEPKLVIATIEPTGDVKFKWDAREDTSTELTTLRRNNLNVTDFERFRRKYYKRDNTFTFKFRAKNKFNPADFIDLETNIPVKNLSPGWHHFCFGYDAKVESIGYFYVDGMLIEELPLSTILTRGKHAFTDIMSKTATIGATQGYNNILLADYIKQPGYYFAKNAQIKSYRLYNHNLYRTFVKALSREHITIPDIDWVIPSGRRAHLDHVSRFHVHQLPGYKTGDFEINLTNTGLSGDAQLTLQTELSAVVYQNKPAITNEVKFNWIETARPSK